MFKINLKINWILKSYIPHRLFVKDTENNSIDQKIFCSSKVFLLIGTERYEVHKIWSGENDIKT